MRVILSRKGVDSAAGKVPSPIFDDDTLVSLPIPEKRGIVRYADLASPKGNLGELVQDLREQSFGRSIKPTDTAHLDPDLWRSMRQARSPEWRPAFGQDSAAESHLRNQHVQEGDLFLFFGWFRRVARSHGRWGYVPDAPDLHVLFGWLRVDHIHENPVAGLTEHPHFKLKRRYATNSRVYAASDSSRAGYFDKYDQSLRLTAPGKSRSIWRLPAVFCPKGTPALSYHGRPKRWTRDGPEHYLLESVGRGQEFVVDCEQHPGVEEWATKLLARNAGRS